MKIEVRIDAGEQIGNTRKASLKGLVDSVLQNAGLYAAGVNSFGLQVFNKWQCTMVGSQQDNRVLQANPDINFFEQFVQDSIQAQEFVHLFLAVGSVGMPDKIGSGEPDGKNIRRVVFAQVMRLHRFERGRNRHLIGGGSPA